MGDWHMSKQNPGFALHDGQVSVEFIGISSPFDNFLRQVEDLHWKYLLKIRTMMMIRTRSRLYLAGKLNWEWPRAHRSKHCQEELHTEIRTE